MDEIKEKDDTPIKEYRRNYYKKYFSIPENKHKNCKRMMLNYWRKKYCEVTGEPKESILELTVYQLKDLARRKEKHGKID